MVVQATMDFSGKTVLVVGASGVLGSEAVRQLSAKGARVLGTCRTSDSAGSIPAEAALKLTVDLSSPASIDLLCDYLTQNEKIDGLILAAGRVGFGDSQSTDAKNLAELTQINFTGPAQLTSRLVPLLTAGREPFVAAITGVVAEKVFPGMHAYTAGKTALSAWLSSLRMELRRSGVLVIDARPGHTETGLATRAMFGTAPSFPAGMTAEHVVSVILNGIAAGTTVLESSAF